MSQKKSHPTRINQKWTPREKETPKTTEYFVNGVVNNDRKILAEAITFIENRSNAFDNKFELLAALPPTAYSLRIGISGSPGVGKSTFINSLGSHLINLGKKVAVLAVDPSSSVTHGAILGDKTRMYDLTLSQHAFIRPSPTSNVLGGINHFTKETILLCEAAGYDTILIETVGVGQSEIEVRNLVDVFALLLLPGAGDELQGIKKGIVEISDLFIINKADGDLKDLASESKKAYQNAIHLSKHDNERHILTCSSIAEDGMVEVWNQIQIIEQYLIDGDKLNAVRDAQEKRWLENKQKEVFQFWTEQLFKQIQEKPKVSNQNIFEQLTDYHQEIKVFLSQLSVKNEK